MIKLLIKDYEPVTKSYDIKSILVPEDKYVITLSYKFDNSDISFNHSRFFIELKFVIGEDSWVQKIYSIDDEEFILKYITITKELNGNISKKEENLIKSMLMINMYHEYQYILDNDIVTDEVISEIEILQANIGDLLSKEGINEQ